MTVDIERSILSKTGSIIVSPFLLATLFLYGGCSTSTHKFNGENDGNPAQTEAAKAEPAKLEVSEKEKIFTSIDMRLQVLEAKLTSLNDKLDATKMNLETLTSNMKHRETEVLPHPAETAGISTRVPPASNDPEAGFINDDSIMAFRKAMILYQGQKYPEAVLSFSEFIETYPDYPLAGTAQYYIAESYFHQKEYKLARQEFQLVLNNYDQSPHVSDSIRGLASSSEFLHEAESAAKYRQMLTSIFPHSPAAGVRSALPVTPAHDPVATKLKIDEPPTPQRALDMPPLPSASAESQRTTASPAQVSAAPLRSDFPATAPLGSVEHP